MLNHTFTFNGRCSDEFGIKIERKPNLSRSGRKYKSSSVPGRNGNIYQLEDAWEEVTVSYDIFAGGNKNGDAVPSFTEIIEWLNSADGYAELSDTYDLDHYRMAVFVDSTDIESFWHRHGRAIVTFRCTPQRYLMSGAQALEPGDTVINPTNHVAKPVITLTGSGTHSLYQVDKPLNDVSLTDQRLYNQRLEDYAGWAYRYFNTEQNRFVWSFYAISSGGSVSDRDAEFGRIAFEPYQVSAGVYCGLGTAVEVSPGPFYRLSCSAVNSGENKITVLYFSNTGSQYMLDTYQKKSQTGPGDMVMYLKVPDNASRALIIFERPGGTLGDFRYIMLSAGTAPFPFRPYDADTTNSFTLGSRTLRFVANGFAQAVIDCERENITIDGVDANMNASVIDEDENLSVEYLQLDKGTNEVQYGDDITAAIIDPRLWEL